MANIITQTRFGQMICNTNDVYVGTSLIQLGEYESQEVEFFKAVVKENSVVLDIGANVGSHSLVLSSLVGPGGLVWAFEPQRQLFYMLCGNIAINNRNNILAYQQAVSDKPGELRVPELDFNKPNSNLGGMSLERPISPKKSHTTSRITTIDKLKLSRLDFIKIDVENMEMQVLKGGINTIKTFEPIMFIEADRTQTAPAVIRYVKDLGYKTYIFKSYLYNENNFNNNKNNIFGYTGCLNLICIPLKISAEWEKISGMKEIDENVFRDEQKTKTSTETSTETPIDVDSINALINAAQHYFDHFDYDKSLFYLNLANKINPKEPAVYISLAGLKSKQMKYKEALDCLNKAIENNPPIETWNSKGLLLGALNRSEEAIESYEKYLMQKENDATVHFNMSLDMLKKGDFNKGLKEYEWRLLLEKSAAYMEKFGDKPIWDGSPNKRVLMFIEQGVGDFVQFVRYAKLIKERGCYVISEMWNDVKDLFKNFPYIDETVEINKFIEKVDLPEFDCIASWCSMPYIFGTTLETIPNEVPYIYPDGECEKLDGIGIVWAGSTTHENDQTRSCFLKDLKPLEQTGKQLYSLQVGDMNRTWGYTGHTNLLKDSDVNYIDLSSQIKDFNDTAKLVQSLDVIVTVDTSVAHIAGALGKRTYLALGKTNDFRWMHKTSKSPWYPTIKIFRQKEYGKWGEVFERISSDLFKLYK